MQEWYADTLQFLCTLEPVSTKWPSLLNRLMEELPLLLEKEETFTNYFESREYEYEHLAVYFTYRYFLKSYFDCDLLSRAVFAAAGAVRLRGADSRGGGAHRQSPGLKAIGRLEEVHAILAERGWRTM